MTYALECHQLSKSFNGIPAVRDATLHVHTGEFIALLGPSGCGKTTTLRLIAGFETPDSGVITMNGRMIAGKGINIPVEERRIGMVFQDYALFPHVNVADNIGFGLSRNGRGQRVNEMLDVIGLEGLEKRMPYALSGGQQQRVALARALAPQPQILLLDEPFSNLDAALRAQVRSEVHAIIKESGITTVFVTHDQEEALSLADKVAVIFDGRVEQVASPQEIYTRPASRAIATFIGEANLLPGEASGDTAATLLGDVPLAEPAQGPVELCLRPEALVLNVDAVGQTATVTWVEFYGHDQRIGIQLDNGLSLVARADSRRIYTQGQRVGVLVGAPVMAFGA
jgi:iron(III) transport system ATP-binding protein